MALVGDMIFRCRSKIPDLPQTVPAPTIAGLAAGTGGSLPNGPYFVVATQFNAWGESLYSNELTITLAGAQNSFSVNVTPSFGVTFIRVYVGATAGGENYFFQTPLLTYAGTAVNVAILTPLLPVGFPPSRGTAYLLDSDGQQFGASTVFDWLNDSLVNISRAVGGLLDYCGVPTQVGQPMYVMPGEWVEITDIWYGGYWVQGGQRMEFFRRNAVTTGILNSATVSVFTEKQVLEVSYQPDRDSGFTNTTLDMGIADASIPINDTSQFLLPFGFALIGTEIVAYSNLAAGRLGGLIRGLGSSVAQAWPSGTVVRELSLFWCGKRLFTSKYLPGQSALTLVAPVGWESIIPVWMLAQAKKAELDMQAASQLEESCLKQAKDWLLGNKGVVRRIQVGGSGGTMVYSGTVAGGIIIPVP